MKIALIKKRYSLRAGGSERYCVNLARRLMALGHGVTVIGESIDEPLAGEVAFIAVPVNRATSWMHNRSFAVNAGRIARNGDYDIVYGLGRAFGLNAVRVTERLQSHWLKVRYQGLSKVLQPFNPRHRTLIDLERTIYESPEVKRIVTQSQLDRRLVQQHYNVPAEKIRVIYNGVDTSVFHPGVRAAREDVRREWNIPRDAPLLVFASMDFEGKGLRAILRSLSLMKTDGVRLLVLGNGPIRRFQQIAANYDVAKRVMFAGRRDGIERFFGAADLCVLPTAYEPFPNVNLEALACGTPVMTTTSSGSVDVIKENETGYFLAGMNAAEELAAFVDLHFALPPKEKERMSAKCWDTAKTLTVERNVRETVNLFEEIIGETTRLRNVG